MFIQNDVFVDLPGGLMNETHEITPNATVERRNPQCARIPFEALVELGASQGSAFEAESINLSNTGMHLRTSYLPNVGTALSVRFESGSGASVVAKGEVVWLHNGPEGNEFGVRFVDVQPQDAEAIRQLVGLNSDSPNACQINQGAMVRLYVEGVESPMRATLHEDTQTEAIVGSELKMLKLGALIEVEEREHQIRKVAHVEDVRCELDPTSHVPQLVVKLRYTQQDTKSSNTLASPQNAMHASGAASQSVMYEASAKSVSDSPDLKFATTKNTQKENSQQSDDASLETETNAITDNLKRVGQSVQRGARNVGQAAARLGGRIATTASLLVKRKGENETMNDDLQKSSLGKSRALRSQSAANAEQNTDVTSKNIRRKQIALAAAAAAAVVLGILAFRKPSTPNANVANKPAAELSASTSVAALPPITPSATPVASLDPNRALATNIPVLVGEPTGLDPHGKPNPFGTPSIRRGTRLSLRFNEPITEIRGLQTPEGFKVSIPNRRALEGAAGFMAKDTRVSSAKVNNLPNGGAELEVAFKESVPLYAVRAKGATLEVTVARDKATAKKNSKARKASHSSKSHKDQ